MISKAGVKTSAYKFLLSFLHRGECVVKSMQFVRIILTFSIVFFIMFPSIHAADIEGDTWPEFDI